MLLYFIQVELEQVEKRLFDPGEYLDEDDLANQSNNSDSEVTKKKPAETKQQAKQQALEDIWYKNGDQVHAGEEQVVFSTYGPYMKIVMPSYRENNHAYSHWRNGRAVVWMECTKTCPKTLFPCKGYTKHLVDEEMVKTVHSHLIGMLSCWRTSAMDILRKVLKIDLFNDGPTEMQDWCIYSYLYMSMCK